MNTITSPAAAHYIAIGDGDNDWYWTKSFDRAHRFPSKDAARKWLFEKFGQEGVDRYWILS